MSKYYYGFFRDTNTELDPDGRLFKVVVKTKKGAGTEELLLNGSPFTVTYESSTELFKPYKCSTAVVGLLAKEYNDHFICESITDNEVKLLKLKEGVEYSDDLIDASADSEYFDVEWDGYTTPNVFSQGYNSYYDEFELECQDKLSILKYYKWSDLTHILNNQMTSVYSILFDICSFLKLDTLFVTNSLRIPHVVFNANLRDYMYNFCNRLYVIDSTLQEDGEAKYVADILEDILSYISLTAVQVGNDMYIVNYNAIATGFGDYTAYTIDGYIVSQKKVALNYDINAADSASNGTNLSVKDSYDDFTITTSQEDISRDYPSVEWYNKTLSDYIDDMYSYCDGRIVSSGNVSQLMKIASWDGYSVYQQILGVGTGRVKGYTSLQFYGFNPSDTYYTPEFAFFAYESDISVSASGFYRGNRISDYEPGQCCLTGTAASIRNRVSSMPISYTLLQEEDFEKGLDKSHEDGIFICHPLSNASTMTDDQWLSLIDNEFNIVSQTMLEIKYKNVNLTPEHPLCWRAQVQFFADYIPCCFEAYNTVSKVYGRWNMSIILKTLNKTLYYDPEHQKWSYTRCIIHPSLGINVGDKMFGEKHKFNNNPQNQYNVSEYEDGVVISAYGEEYHGDITIRLYRPFGPDSTFTRTTTSTILTDVKLEFLDSRAYSKSFVEDSAMLEYKDADKFINEVKSEELKYTASASNPNIDNNMYTQNASGEYEKLDYILDIPAGDVFRCEEQRLRDNVKQFLTPQLSFETCTHAYVDMLTRVTYHRFDGKAFVVNGVNVDYRNNARTVNIVEK